MKSLDNAEVLVGIPSDSEKNARDDTPETNAEIGFVNEFGEPSMNIPPRPFLMPGVAAGMPKCEKVMLNAGKDVMRLPSNPEQIINNAMEAVGLISQNAVQQQIVDGKYAPLSPYTLAQRKSRGFMGTKPLIETGSLKASITYVVNK